MVENATWSHGKRLRVALEPNGSAPVSGDEE